MNFGDKVIFIKYLLNFDYSDNYRKIIIETMEEEKIGIVIGKVIRYEGIYRRGWVERFFGESEPGELTNRKGFWFYVVALKMNITMLVPVDDVKKIKG